MQLVRLPTWAYALTGLVLLAVGVAVARPPIAAAGVVVLAVAALRFGGLGQ